MPIDALVPDRLAGIPLPILFFLVWGVAVFLTLRFLAAYYRKRTRSNFREEKGTKPFRGRGPLPPP